MSKQEKNMQLAEILSDLVSLRVCPPDAALALVSARPIDESNSNVDAKTEGQQDVDLTRAKDLLKLHNEVKEAHRRGELSRGLDEARAAVEKAVGDA